MLTKDDTKYLVLLYCKKNEILVKEIRKKFLLLALDFTKKVL